MGDSLWYMFDNHTFMRIDNAPDFVTAASRLMICRGQDPYGLLGTKGREHDTIIHTRHDPEGIEQLELLKEFVDG